MFGPRVRAAYRPSRVGARARTACPSRLYCVWSARSRSVSTLTLTRAALRTDDAVIPWETIDHVEVLSRRGGHDLLVTVDGVEQLVAAHAQWTPMSTLRGVIARHAAQSRTRDGEPRIPAALQAMRQQGEPAGE